MVPQLEIRCGDWIEQLKLLPADSVQCCVTSPPYFGLRDYEMPGQVGLEKTPEEYVQKLVEGFRELRRVLRPDGTVWLNLGDSYWGSWGNYSGQNRGNGTQREIVNGSRVSQPAYYGREGRRPGSTLKHAFLKPKDIIGIPFRVAFALQQDGWWLRQDIVWSKKNCTPESVEDRCTRSHEYIFLLTKSRRYYYNADAIKERMESGKSDLKKMHEGKDRIGGKNKLLDDPMPAANKQSKIGRKRAVGDGKLRNRRSVWSISLQAYKGAHFAVFPPNLIRPCILAGSRPGDMIIDLFFGSGTTGRVALELGRSCIGLELNPDYVKLAENRCHVTPGLPL